MVRQRYPDERMIHNMTSPKLDGFAPRVGTYLYCVRYSAHNISTI